MARNNEYDANAHLTEESKKRVSELVEDKSKNARYTGPIIDAVLIALALIVLWEIGKSAVAAWS